MAWRRGWRRLWCRPDAGGTSARSHKPLTPTSLSPSPTPLPPLPLLHPPTLPLKSLTRELEKKFSDRHVVFIGQRRMMRKPTRVSRIKQQRPRSRTLKEVHEKILEDLVYPTVSLCSGSWEGGASSSVLRTLWGG